MIRAVALAATIAVLLCMWIDRPPAKQPTWLESLVPQVSQVDFCVIDERAAAKDETSGEWQFFWSEGYGPCDQQDKFRDI